MLLEKLPAHHAIIKIGNQPARLVRIKPAPPYPEDEEKRRAFLEAVFQNHLGLYHRPNESR